MNVISIIIACMLTSNIILSSFLGVCPFLGLSKNPKNAFGMGIALTFVVTMSAIICYAIERFILQPLELDYLQLIVFILIIASFVQFVEFFIKKYFKSLYNALGIYLPLITTNCVVLYVTKQICDVPALMAGLGLSSDLISNGGFDFLFAMVYALGTGCGYFLVIFIFSTIREKVDHAPVVKGFEGAGIALVTTAILALAITGLAGLF